MFTGSFFGTRGGEVEDLNLSVVQRGFRLSSRLQFLGARSFPTMTLEDTTKVGLGGELRVVRCLEDVVPVEGSENALEFNGEFNFRRLL